MKCEMCLYNGSCSLQDIAEDISGCEGHSKERPLNEVRYSLCDKVVDRPEEYRLKAKSTDFK